MRRINRLLYAAFGVVGAAFGVMSLVAPRGASAGERHLMSEVGAAGVFVGLMSFWCVLNYARRRAVHHALCVFAVLVAGIHWRDDAGGHLPLASAVVNSVPAAVLLLMLLALRDGVETRGGSSGA